LEPTNNLPSQNTPTRTVETCTACCLCCTGQTDGLHRSDRWPAPVRPVTPVRPVHSAGQASGYRSRTTSVPESLSDFSRPWNKNTPKTKAARKENPTQNLTKQPQTDQEQTNSTKTQRHRSQAVHPRQIPQVARTGQTDQEHRSDRCNLGSSG
jgi:hypothetical protein